jgi:hypothetical protein
MAEKRFDKGLKIPIVMLEANKQGLDNHDILPR